jgi:glycosyltransferase involved in cell wall biosynthesis
VRIAVYHNLPSGGAKRALYEISCRLAKAHSLDVYTLSSAEHDFCDMRPVCDEHLAFPFNPLPQVHAPLGRLNRGVRAFDLLRLRALERRIAHQIDEGAYDLVFAHHCQFGQSPSILSFIDTPSVYYCNEPPRWIYEPHIARPYTSHTSLPRFFNLLDPLPWLYRRLVAAIDRANVLSSTLVLTNSDYSRESIYRSYGLFARPGYLGVDAKHFRPTGAHTGNVFLSVGAIRPDKGFDYIIRSLSLLNPQRRLPLVIVNNGGDNRERRYLSRLAADLDVSLRFRTMLPDQELVWLYNRAALTLYTPVMEPFGFVPLESMACATPVVGVREGGIRESVVDGVTGLLVDRDPQQFAAAVRSLLDDDERRARYGRQAREYVLKNWSWDRSVAQIERHLTEVALQRE